MKRTRTQAYTLLELLITIAILGVLLALVASNLQAYRDRLSADNFLATLASDFNVSRTRTLSTGEVRRIRLVSTTNYVLEQSGAGGTWTPLRNATFNKAILDLTATTARTYLFSTRGFVKTTDASGSDTTATTIVSLLGSGARQLTVTALGIARRE